MHTWARALSRLHSKVSTLYLQFIRLLCRIFTRHVIYNAGYFVVTHVDAYVKFLRRVQTPLVAESQFFKILASNYIRKQTKKFHFNYCFYFQFSFNKYILAQESELRW